VIEVHRTIVLLVSSDQGIEPTDGDGLYFGQDWIRVLARIDPYPSGRGRVKAIGARVGHPSKGRVGLPWMRPMER
jgi:hypothetical protein